MHRRRRSRSVIAGCARDSPNILTFSIALVASRRLREFPRRNGSSMECLSARPRRGDGPIRDPRERGLPLPQRGAATFSPAPPKGERHVRHYRPRSPVPHDRRSRAFRPAPARLRHTAIRSLERQSFDSFVEHVAGAWAHDAAHHARCGPAAAGARVGLLPAADQAHSSGSPSCSWVRPCGRLHDWHRHAGRNNISDDRRRGSTSRRRRNNLFVAERQWAGTRRCVQRRMAPIT